MRDHEFEVEDSSAADSSSNRPGVLVVDDDNLVLIMLQLGLERYGFNVWPAHNGVEAIQTLREQDGRITMAILDLNMPDQDGAAIWEALRKIDPDLRVCFMSGDLNERRVLDLTRRGAALLIAKPFLIHELAELLRLQANHESVGLRQPAVACN